MSIKRHTPCWICGLPILRGDIFEEYEGLEAHIECIEKHKETYGED